MNALPLLTAALLSAGLLARAEDWPQWGGNDPGRNFYSPAKGLPDRFEPGKLKTGTEEIDLATTKGVKWAVKLGSQSYGNPVVAGGKVYVGTNNESPRDKKQVGDRSILYCFDEKTGAFLWQLVVPKLKSGKVNDWESLGLLASPLVVGNRLWIVTSRCEVLCLDTEGMANGNEGPYTDEAKYMAKDTPKESAPVDPSKQDADLIWRYDMMDELGVFPHNASNSSVLMVDGILYICTSNGQDWTHVNIPSPTSPSFIALDAKINFDSNALFRHPDIVALRDLDEEDPAEIEASKFDLSYISLDGNIGCLVNGAGLAMASMDTIKLFGGEPANFLDVGGGATAEKVTEAFKIMLKNPKVKGIMVNIFGGIMKCDTIANGVVVAAREVKLSVPLVVRMRGTNEEMGRQILKDSGLPIISATNMADAAKSIVAAVK